ncbi:hypothetical protein [Pseudomonas matsuisoli]|uniref:Uncharacterized protein n=1 Tax=Pseudomonas matsuisoli TaxID=1515666 RepID=A0A917PZX1_9PSED|nr:hypothetical protein [Pseudomonas matsuisoli]GGK02370.1 hypothetical protein GCM10009304_30200 [Pseudomonas matsuisoli]
MPAFSFEIFDAKDLILLFLGATLGYIFSLIASKQTEKRKDLVLEILGRQIVAESGKSCPFKIIDRAGNTLDNIYFVVARIWNRGRDTVRGDEISPSAPLTIEVNESARVIGEPEIVRPHSQMEFSITSPHQNKFVFSFDCLNHDEWVQVGFYITGDPRASIKGAGRIFGQHSDFEVTTDDSKASFYERLTASIAFLIVVSSPFALIGALWWTYEYYSITDIFFNPDSLPKSLMFLLSLGMMVISAASMYYLSLWIKRKNNPKGYPIREDFEPTQRQSLRAFFLTALHGKRYEVSTSVHDYGEIKTRSKGQSSSKNRD